MKLLEPRMPDDAPLPGGQLPVVPSPVDYVVLSRINAQRYGSEWGRLGRPLLVDRYAQRTHFIYELLQNAEDALRKRIGWSGDRSVRFELSDTALVVSHFGKPFDEADVRGICGIIESTKDLTAIGRFGIGFKSVYAFTTRPEVHSGAEDFAIERFVLPVAVPPVSRHPDETVIVLPLERAADAQAIAAGLATLGPQTLLFLRELDQIEWRVQGGASGFYLREETAATGEFAREMQVIGQQAGQPEIEENWLLFSRPMHHTEGEQVGHIELGFRLDTDANGRRHIRRIARSLLNVFFPTVVETHLGFLLQGPLRTTPSRDAVPAEDAWNGNCVEAAGEVLAEALRWLRDGRMLDASALECLPLDRGKFADGMFVPLYDRVRAILASEPLLPAENGGYLPASQALLGRGRELRQLLDQVQLTALFGQGQPCNWLAGDITQDRALELRQYLVRELGVGEVTPASLLNRLQADFLARQPDTWIERLYGFLSEQSGLRADAMRMPLVRLEDGSHVRPHNQGTPLAFLIGDFETGFPTVRAAVCKAPKARAFLQSLGITVPDRVDDVICNLLPKYRQERVSLKAAEYAADIERILAASQSDSRKQRERLIGELRSTLFVLSVRMADGAVLRARPEDVFLATERLKELLQGVKGAFIVDERYTCLRGQEIRDLLEVCGASRHLRLVRGPGLDWDARAALREKTGHAETSGQNDAVSDLTLFGLDQIVAKLADLDVEARRRQARFLWEELALIEDRRGRAVFRGEYSWTHYGRYRAAFPATFVKRLNHAAWVPDARGELRPPADVLFESLGWPNNAFLLDQFRFKPPVIAQLAQEAGIEAGVLDLLRGLGLTSEAELRARLGVLDLPAPAPPSVPPPAVGGPGERGEDTRGNQSDQQHGLDAGAPGAGNANPRQATSGTTAGDCEVPPDPPAHPDGASASGRQPDRLTAPTASGPKRPDFLPQKALAAPLEDGSRPNAASPPQPSCPSSPASQPQRPERSEDPSSLPGRRLFISYIAVQSELDPVDPDGLTHAARMNLEEAAIACILREEPDWQRTPAGNPGFDLFKLDAAGEPCVWCEVKAMTGSLDDHPVGMSHTQFEFARNKGADAWLYVVEQAGTRQPNIVRIGDPAGQARTFTFDRGWRAVAVPGNHAG